MPNPSVSMDDELLEDLDDKIWDLKVEEKIDRKASRSQVIEELIRQWVEGNSNPTFKRLKTSTTTETATAD